MLLGVSGLPVGATAMAAHPARFGRRRKRHVEPDPARLLAITGQLHADDLGDQSGSAGGQHRRRGLVLISVTGPIWNGGSATDNNWSDAANWSGYAIASNAVLQFGGGARLINTNDTAAGTVYSNLNFNSVAGSFVLNGNSITLAGNVTNNSSNPQTIALGLKFSGNLRLQRGRHAGSLAPSA